MRKLAAVTLLAGLAGARLTRARPAVPDVIRGLPRHAVLVLALNVTAVGDVATLVARSARLIAGRPVTLRVRRGDSTLDLRARAVGARSRRRPASRSTAGRWTR